MNPVLATRRAGVLLHPTSLPGPRSCGTLGADAWRFVDFLRAGGFSVWQTLPLGPVDAYGSPYCLRSAYAGDARLIDADHLRALPQLPQRMVFDAGGDLRLEAYRSFCSAASAQQLREFAQFLRRQRGWLLPYGVFELCSARFSSDPWWCWPEPFRRCHTPTLFELLAQDREHFRSVLFEQYLFDLQWSALKRYANERGVYLFGDLPIYVDLNSVEVWWNRELFRLDADGTPVAVAGVPPDYFNADGQLWGNPLYDWERMRKDGFQWWLQRLRAQFARFDLVRIDHFRALESYWEVPVGAATAREGVWRHGVGDRLLTAIKQNLGEIPLVAEDLGMITNEVRALRDRFDLPGMLVLQFAFDGTPDNPHLPANHRRNAVVYTGTHDNDTTVGWYFKLDDSARAQVHQALGLTDAPQVPDFLVDAAYASRSQLAVIPMQDLLGLDSSSRMNTPGSIEGNWHWRFDWSQVDRTVATKSLQRAQQYERLTRRFR
ncbi:MAG TPA: 4-alpha-glucanotransferase [Gammaproteobacteria bacterium]|nr:4-alpha-glucanotransferase [Gammaproteobacteria bacterium]